MRNVSQAAITANPATAEYTPVTKWPYEWPTQGSWRALIFNAEDRINSKGERFSGNGLIECGAIRRVGRRVLVNPAKFFSWVEAHGRA
jgi:hypothetical protein